MKKAVTAIVFSDDRKGVLLIKRRDVPIWVLPGGAVENNESAKKAIIRETQEESGLEVKIKRLVGVYTPINRLGTETLLFECTNFRGRLTTGDETSALGFFEFHKLPKNFFHIHRDMLLDALQDNAATIKKPLSQVTYFALLKYFIRHPLIVIRFLLSKIGLPINS